MTAGASEREIKNQLKKMIDQPINTSGNFIFSSDFFAAAFLRISMQFLQMSGKKREKNSRNVDKRLIDCILILVMNFHHFPVDWLHSPVSLMLALHSHHTRRRETKWTKASENISNFDFSFSFAIAQSNKKNIYFIYYGNRMHITYICLCIHKYWGNIDKQARVHVIHNRTIESAM